MSQLTTKDFFNQDGIKTHVKRLLGQKSELFISNVLSIVNSSALLQKCDPASIYQSALMATTLDLPLNQNLGFAYIIPYGDKAQFQIGYKGYIQLAQRSGQFLKINACPIYEGQISANNPLTGFEFDFSVQSDVIIGYAAYFKLLNGYEQTLFMTIEDLNKHGKKFSQTFKKGFGLWKDDFESMARKTVLKLLLQRFAPLSIEMQRAEIADQSVIHDAETLEVSYADNTPLSIDEVNNDKERSRVASFIESAKNVDELMQVHASAMTHGLEEEFNTKHDKLSSNGKK